jgi:chaperonin GroEL
MSTRVFYDDDARSRILSGAEILYKAVKTTMGPRGRNVVISRAYRPPVVTHDGVTVAKAVELQDESDINYGQRVGAELIKQAASKMNDVAGDGTTTVTVLTYHILAEANKLIAAGHDPMLLSRQIDEASEEALSKLKVINQEIVERDSEVAHIATISAGDAQIGSLIASMIEKVGKDGVVTVEEGRGLTVESEVVEGFTFDRGFVSPYMITDSVHSQAVYEDVAILVTDKKVLSNEEFMPILGKLADAKRGRLLLIAEDIGGEALSFMIINKLKGAFNTVAVRTPSFGDKRIEVLNDIATLTGATVITEGRDMKFADVGLEVVGWAKKVIVSQGQTTIIEGGGTTKDIQTRIKQINTQRNAATSDYDKENLQERAAALGGRVGIIRVGGVTQTEIEEKKFRVDDAVAAVKGALSEGIVPGGGTTMRTLGDAILSDSPGAQLLKRALNKPFDILLTNSGLEPAAYYNKVKFGFGVNVRDGKIVNLKKTGIIDPTRVTREAIKNAVSIAGTAITMGALLVEPPAPPPEHAAL